MAVFILSCQNNPPTREADIPDSLNALVQKRIEEKKRREEYRREYLKPEFSRKIKKYYPIIRKYSKRYGMDWRLITAQIIKESRFKEDARSQVGAMGLMQIMPLTAKDITRELDIEYITRDPRENIAAGIYHLYKQQKYFQEADPENRIKLALAAYNAGAGRVFDAQDIARYLRMNPNTWEAVRTALPHLTNKDWKMHLEVWEQGTPPHGYFYGYEQTINYVDDITHTYQIFKKLF